MLQQKVIKSDKYTVSPALHDAKEYWDLALGNYNEAGQFTVMGADDYNKGDETSASTNFQKATTFFNMGTGNVELATDSMKTQ